MGTCYLLHIEPPYKRAKHYLGWTKADDSPTRRFDTHLAGRGSPLIKAAIAAGSTVTISRTWAKASRTDERALKNQKNAPRFCPICKAKHK